MPGRVPVLERADQVFVSLTVTPHAYGSETAGQLDVHENGAHSLGQHDTLDLGDEYLRLLGLATHPGEHGLDDTCPGPRSLLSGHFRQSDGLLRVGRHEIPSSQVCVGPRAP